MGICRGLARHGWIAGLFVVAVGIDGGSARAAEDLGVSLSEAIDIAADFAGGNVVATAFERHDGAANLFIITMARAGSREIVLIDKQTGKVLHIAPRIEAGRTGCSQ